MEIAEKIKSALVEKRDFASIAEYLDEKWPNELYMNTVIEEADKMENKNKMKDYAILADFQSKEGNQIIKRPKVKYAG